MSLFYEALTVLEKLVYGPNQLTIKSIQEEKQNLNYGGGTFRLPSKTVRFRVAKKTPTKVGQFVAFGKKIQIIKTNPLQLKKHQIY